MRTRNVFAAIVAIGLLVIGAAGVLADIEPGGANVTAQEDRGAFQVSAPGTVNVTAGNITAVTLDTDVSTYRWVGIFGNATGNIVLGDADNNRLFEWVARGRIVYASEAASPDWSVLAAADVTDMPAWLNNVDFSDRYQETFGVGGQNDPLDSGIFNILAANYALSLDNVATGVWRTYSLIAGADLVWAGIVAATPAAAFDGTDADFQMILPEDGTLNNTVVTTYNLWVELI